MKRMPRKLPAAYVRKLNEEQKRVRLVPEKRVGREASREPDAGRLRSYTMICQACGARVKFTVDQLGYATCGNCRSIASYRFGNVG